MLCEHSIQAIADEGMHRGPVLGGQDLDLRSYRGFYMNCERDRAIPSAGVGWLWRTRCSGTMPSFLNRCGDDLKVWTRHKLTLLSVSPVPRVPVSATGQRGASPRLLARVEGTP